MNDFPPLVGTPSVTCTPGRAGIHPSTSANDRPYKEEKTDVNYLQILFNFQWFLLVKFIGTPLRLSDIEDQRRMLYGLIIRCGLQPLATDFVLVHVKPTPHSTVKSGPNAEQSNWY